MSDEQPFQLDLTATIQQVPQANSLPLFIRVVEEIQRGVDEIQPLSERLEVEERTVHYYVDFGRWLDLLRTPSRGKVALSETGKAFAGSVPARGRLFAAALFSRTLVQTINAIKREAAENSAQLDTRTACLQAIQRMSELSESTARRRASGLAHMLEAAYKPSRIDWATGEPRPEYQHIAFDFEGRTFLTAMAARQFGAAREYRIAFPLQVRRFVEGGATSMRDKIWRRASHDTADGQGSWFGNVPVDEATIEIAGRKGRDLRKLVTMCAPYVTLATVLLTYRDPARRLSVRLTHDMYGLRFWEHDRELGPPLEVIETFARGLGLAPTQNVPRALSKQPAELTAAGGDEDLVEVLRACGIVRAKDTTFSIAPGFEDELREGGESAPSIAERLAPLHERLRQMLRDWSRYR